MPAGVPYLIRYHLCTCAKRASEALWCGGHFTQKCSFALEPIRRRPDEDDSALRLSCFTISPRFCQITVQMISSSLLTAILALFLCVGHVHALDVATCNASAGFDWVS